MFIFLPFEDTGMEYEEICSRAQQICRFIYRNIRKNSIGKGDGFGFSILIFP